MQNKEAITVQYLVGEVRIGQLETRGDVCGIVISHYAPDLGNNYSVRRKLSSEFMPLFKEEPS